MVSVDDLKYARLLHTGALCVMDRMAPLNADDPTPAPGRHPHPPFPSHPQHPHLLSSLSLPSPPYGSNYDPVTPVNPERLLSILSGVPNSHLLYEGFKFGFRIPHIPSPWSNPIRNHKSVLQNPSFMDQYVSQELEARRIVGPFEFLPPHCIISPLGLVPKQEPGAYRVIHDLSFPKGRGVNDFIPNSLTSVSYEDFDYVSSLIRQAGAGALIAKVDIKNAFRIMPIHKDYIHLFGFFMAWGILFG